MPSVLPKLLLHTEELSLVAKLLSGSCHLVILDMFIQVLCPYFPETLSPPEAKFNICWYIYRALP